MGSCAEGRSLAPEQPSAVAAVDQLIAEARRLAFRGWNLHLAGAAGVAIQLGDGAATPAGTQVVVERQEVGWHRATRGDLASLLRRQAFLQASLFGA